MSAERLDDKLLVHDYGHGGGGITLSWGTATLAVDIAESEGRSRAGSPPRAAVLGGDVVGLSTPATPFAHVGQKIAELIR